MMSRTGTVLIFCLLCGCAATERIAEWAKSDDDNADPPAPLVEFRQGLNIIKLWSENTGSGTNEQYLHLAPVIANQKVYIADVAGNVKSLDATNGRTVWNRKIGSGIAGKFKFWSKEEVETVTGGPGYGENTVLVGTSEGRVVAYSADRGDELWQTRVTSEILSAPIKANNIVIIRTLDGKIFALEGNSGKRMWVYDRSVPTLTLRGTSMPVIFENIVIAGFDGGRMAALELQTGRLLWEITISEARGSTDIERMIDIDSTPLVLNGIIYVATYQGDMVAMRLETGQEMWRRKISSYAGFSADEDNIYVTDEDSHIWAFDRYSGNSIWKQEKLQARGVTAATLIDDYIVVGDFQGYLHWLQKDTGNFIARSRLSKERIIVKPIVAGKFLYAYCSDGTMGAYTYR